jgi:hypothetical protein
MFLFRIELPPIEMRRSEDRAPIAQFAERAPEFSWEIAGHIILFSFLLTGRSSAPKPLD